MSPVCHIARDEWRYWLRSNLAICSAVFVLVLLLVTSVLNHARMTAQTEAREHQQHHAEETFLSQPDRHPHRMVHYGHYVFRGAAPLSAFDPGLDTVTGQSIFLEGHRQNSAMFADGSASADFGGMSWLTPAFVYQVFVPLLLIFLGHGAIVRERESGTLVQLLAQGVNGGALVAGKLLALVSVAAILLLPLMASVVAAVVKGESALAGFAMVSVYFVYLCVWCAGVIGASALLRKRAGILASLMSAWVVFGIVLPSIAVNTTALAKPMPGKIQVDLATLEDVRKLGDGHNANDPAFAKLRADLLEKYNVDRVEDLPINLRGVVAQAGEARLTDVLNKYAEARMNGEAQQADTMAFGAFASPVLGITFASRAIAATDLAHYHRFLEEAETVRYDFIQGLNKAHIEALSYEDDMNRNKDAASWEKARVSANNWQVLNEYQFTAAPVQQRISAAALPMVSLCLWLGLFGFVAVAAGRGLKP